MGCETKISRDSVLARPARVIVMVVVLIVALAACALMVAGCGKSDPEDTTHTATAHTDAARTAIGRPLSLRTTSKTT